MRKEMSLFSYINERIISAAEELIGAKGNASKDLRTEINPQVNHGT